MADQTPWNSSVPSDGERQALLGSGEPPPQASQASRWPRWWPLGLVSVASALLVAVVVWQIILPQSSNRDLLLQADRAIADGHWTEAEAILQDLRRVTQQREFESWPPGDQSHYHTVAAAIIRARPDRSAALAVADARRIVSHLEEARGLGRVLSPADLENLALAHICVGEIAAAQITAQELEETSSELPADLEIASRVLEIRRGLAEFASHHPQYPAERRLELLRDLRDDPSAMLSDLRRAALEMANIRLDLGQSDNAALGLYRDIRRLEARGAGPTPELLVLLGRAQRDQRRNEIAAEVLTSAVAMADAANPVRGEALVLLGDVESQQGNLEKARDYFDEAAQTYPASPCMLAALAGRARTGDALGDQERALLDFGELIRRLARGDRHRDVSVPIAEAVLLDRFEAALSQARTGHALELARLAGQLHPLEQQSIRVSMARAVAAGQVAAEQMAARRTAQAMEEGDLDETEAVALHAESGEAYLRAARAIQEADEDDQRWADAMLQAGIHLDASGRQPEAATIFRDYVNACDARDSRRPDAIFRLAQALETLLSWEEANRWYEVLLEDHARSPQATMAYVPSARSLLALGRDVDARCRLESVVDGRTALRPGAEDYRASLVTLGRLDLAEGRPADAIRRLQEAADRWPDHPITVELIFDIATAHRSLATDVEQRLAEAILSEDERLHLEADRLTNLWEAAISFEQVMERLDDGVALYPDQQHMRRSAAIAGSDCLMETGRLKEAIRGYESVARTWPHHPAAVHALVHVATAWRALGDSDRAEAAHQRALVRLEAIPDELLERDDAFMGRDMWEQWMHTMPMTSDLYAEVGSTP